LQWAKAKILGSKNKKQTKLQFKKVILNTSKIILNIWIEEYEKLIIRP